MDCLAKRTKLVLLSTIAISSLLLLLLLIPPHSSSKHHPLHLTSHFQTDIAARHCDGTLYPDLCLSTLIEIPNLQKKSLPQIITAIIKKTADSVAASADHLYYLLKKRLPPHDIRQRRALNDCVNLFDITSSAFDRAVADLSNNASKNLHDIQTFLSSAMTNTYTCLDGFNHHINKSQSLRPLIVHELHNISHLVSNSLALAKKLVAKQPRRMVKEVFENYGKVVNGFPEWVSAEDRQLLSTQINASSLNLVVAQDGSGHFKTIGEAVAAAPSNSGSRFVIYVKGGTYLENVIVGKKQTNLMFVGDGIGLTVVKGSRNVVDGYTTFQSATVAIVGNGFLARDITFENFAGPIKHQAVALRVGSDLSAFYRCSFVGYQDTLYVLSLRQFYRECDIYGTVDFIFGDAAVVFQSCNVYARKPAVNQKNTITAQGRADPNENTGISIQNCKVTAAADLLPVLSSIQTFLGRPWKPYSRTVYMQSYLDSLINPAGWLAWDGEFALSTLYYGEYMNRGPGSSTGARVNWPGYRVITSSTEASKFTVQSFIGGNQWLGPTSIPFTAGLA